MIERLLAGEAALARDELDAAERLFSQVATADPRNAIALVGLARIAVRQGEVDEARALAGRALGIDPEEAAARRLLAELDSTSIELEAAPAEPDQMPTELGRAPTELGRSVVPPIDPPAVEPVTGQPVAVQRPPARPARAGWRAWLDRLLRRR